MKPILLCAENSGGIAKIFSSIEDQISGDYGIRRVFTSEHIPELIAITRRANTLLKRYPVDPIGTVIKITSGGEFLDSFSYVTNVTLDRLADGWYLTAAELDTRSSMGGGGGRLYYNQRLKDFLRIESAKDRLEISLRKIQGLEKKFANGNKADHHSRRGKRK